MQLGALDHIFTQKLGGEFFLVTRERCNWRIFMRHRINIDSLVDCALLRGDAMHDIQ